MQSRAELASSVHVYASRHESLFALNIFRRINLIAATVRKWIISKNNFLGANEGRNFQWDLYIYIYIVSLKVRIFFIIIFRIKSFIFV